MATYVFKVIETGEVIERFMKMSEYDNFMKANPQLERYYNTVPNICDPVRIGVRKMDNGFKEVLESIHRRTPGSTLNESSSQL